MPSLQVKRGTRAQIDAAALASGLKPGEVYLITDEDRLAVGTSISAYQAFAKTSEASSASVNVQEFTTPGTSTWTKPAGAKLVIVECLGGGGGGGGGTRQASTVAYYGGGAGGGASYARREIDADDLPATASVTVGAGGTGGAAASADNTLGGTANPGLNSVFNAGSTINHMYTIAYGGSGGNGGAPTSSPNNGGAGTQTGTGGTGTSTQDYNGGYSTNATAGGNSIRGGASGGPGGWATANYGSWAAGLAGGAPVATNANGAASNGGTQTNSNFTGSLKGLDATSQRMGGGGGGTFNVSSVTSHQVRDIAFGVVSGVDTLAMMTSTAIFKATWNGTTWGNWSLAMVGDFSATGGNLQYVNGIWIYTTQIATSGIATIWSSTDLSSFTATNVTTASGFRAVAYGNGIWVAITGSTIFSSTDFVNWTSRATGTFYDVTFGAGTFCVVGNATGSRYSTDGINWTNVSGLPATSTSARVVYGGGYFVTYTTSAAWKSTDGINWVTGGTISGPTDIAAGVNVAGQAIFVAVGASVVYTNNPAVNTTWTVQPDGQTYNYNYCIYTGYNFVAGTTTASATPIIWSTTRDATAFTAFTGFNLATRGWDGGNGGLGAGGGGGGPGINGTVAGKGGNGGNGFVRVTTYF